jgi:hypothetical protein
MSVVLDPKVNTSGDGASSPPAKVPAPRVNAQVVASPHPELAANEAQTNIPASDIPQASVTFRRDPAGQIYYVVTDTQSGKELRQVPPEELRKVG